jgi:CubicO group peptidase (beta-lactamase class C family)
VSVEEAGMGELQVEVEPSEVGLDQERLGRLTAYLDRLVALGRIPGWLAVVSRAGSVAYLGKGGHRHVEDGLPVETDTIFRIYSMTKPITSVAAMMLLEEGAYELTTPVGDLIPSFREMRVYTGGSDLKPVTVPATEPVRIWHLLTHTAGLTYGFHRVHPVDALLREAGYDWSFPENVDLGAVVDVFAGLPLLFQPGTEWNYSLATDVLGRLVEVASGTTFDRFLAERIFEPLGMTDTSFGLAGPDSPEAARLARLYAATPNRGLLAFDQLGERFKSPATAFSGGGGLLSTAADYHRFVEMLRGGGQLDGVRILGPLTVAAMTRNYLPGNADLETFGRPLFAETPYRGVGFGLGFGVVIDPARSGMIASKGDYSWGGAASTSFWVDPLEDISVVFMTQVFPSSALPIRGVLRQLVNQAIVA